MLKLLRPIMKNGETIGYFFECPGCLYGHAVTIRPHTAENGSSWDFNGNLDSPTFSPSILSRVQFKPEAEKDDMVCHLFVTDGKIRFLDDCTHNLAGQTIDMVDADSQTLAF